jgi:hypothetical protein
VRRKRALALVGTHQDLIGGHEAKSLLIADSERIAHCGPSSIAPPPDERSGISPAGAQGRIWLRDLAAR